MRSYGREAGHEMLQLVEEVPALHLLQGHFPEAARQVLPLPVPDQCAGVEVGGLGREGHAHVDAVLRAAADGDHPGKEKKQRLYRVVSTQIGMQIKFIYIKT